MSYSYILINNYQKGIIINDSEIWVGMSGFTEALPTETRGILAEFEWRNGSGKEFIVNNLDDNVPIEDSPFTLSSYSKYQPLIDLYLAAKADYDKKFAAIEEAQNGD